MAMSKEEAEILAKKIIESAKKYHFPAQKKKGKKLK